MGIALEPRGIDGQRQWGASAWDLRNVPDILVDDK